MTSAVIPQCPVRTKGLPWCAYHKQKEVIFVCSDCNELICPTCSVSIHKNHNFVELCDDVKQKKSSLQEFVNITESRVLPNLKLDIQTAEKTNEENSSNLKDVAEKFKQHGEECKKEIDIQIVAFAAICDKMDRQNLILLQKFKKETQERCDLLTKLVKDCKDALQTGTHVQVYDVGTEIHKTYTDPKILTLQKADFYPCHAISDNIRRAFGTVSTFNDHYEEELCTSKKNSPAEFKMQPKLTDKGSSSDQSRSNVLLEQPLVQTHFKSKSEVYKVRPTCDGCAWVFDGDSTFTLLDNGGQVKQEVKHHCLVKDISLAANTGHLWFSSTDKTINEIPSISLSIIARFRTEDFPRRLCATNDDKVVVGTPQSVTIYTSAGTRQHINLTPKGVSWTLLDICQCPISGNIAVANMDLGGKRHIDVYDNTLNLVFQFRGEGIKGVTPNTFGPWSIIYDHRGRLVIVDNIRKAIELLDGKGQYIKTLQTYKGEQGRVGIQTNDVLWIALELDVGEWEIQLLKYYKD